MKPHKIVTQDELVSAFDNDDIRYYWVQGGRGSGKTYLTLRKWLNILVTNPDLAGTTQLFIAKRERQIRNQLRNFVYPFFKEMGILKHCKFAKDEWQIPNMGGDYVYVEPFIFGEAGADQRAEDIRGLEFTGGYAEEYNNCNPVIRAIIHSCFGRNYADFKFFATTNPGNENSEYQRFIQQDRDDADYMVVPTRMNEHIPSSYIEQLRFDYPLPWQQKRYIDGLPADGSGLFLPGYKDYIVSKKAQWGRLYVGIDYGDVYTSAAVLLGYHHQVGWHVVANFEYNGAKHGAITERELASRIIKWAQSYGEIDGWAVDKTAGALRVRIEDILGKEIWKSFMNRDESDEQCKAWFESKMLTSEPTNEYLNTEMAALHYPELKNGTPDKENNKRVKIDDHSWDALRYILEVVPVSNHPYLARSGSR